MSAICKNIPWASMVAWFSLWHELKVTVSRGSITGTSRCQFYSSLACLTRTNNLCVVVAFVDTKNSSINAFCTTRSRQVHFVSEIPKTRRPCLGEREAISCFGLFVVRPLGFFLFIIQCENFFDETQGYFFHGLSVRMLVVPLARWRGWFLPQVTPHFQSPWALQKVYKGVG